VRLASALAISQDVQEEFDSGTSETATVAALGTVRLEAPLRDASMA